MDCHQSCPISEDGIDAKRSDHLRDAFHDVGSREHVPGMVDDLSVRFTGASLFEDLVGDQRYCFRVVQKQPPRPTFPG